jgi:DNA invertase Pin-like site-specific DNA recombinase
MLGYVRYSPRVRVAKRKARPGSSDGDNPANSVANQQDSIQRWLKSHGRDPLQEGDWIIDELTSARTTPLCDRTGGADLLERIQAGDHEVIASRIDRLFRSVPDGLLQLEAWKKQKVSLYLADGVVVDLSTVSGWACTTMLLMCSEWFPRHVAECTSAAKLSQQRAGQRVSGNPPFGYRLCPDNHDFIEVDKREQAACDEIVRLHSSGLTLAQIARQMEDAGVQSRTGKPWHHKMIRRIITRHEDEEL